MQLTIEVPDDLAHKPEPYREHLEEILRLGMYRCSGSQAYIQLASEVIERERRMRVA